MPESISGWRWERHRLKDENDEWYDCPGCEKCLHDNPLFPPLHVLRKSSWRHTRAHEYVFMLTKQMQYFCNQEVVREPDTGQKGAAADLVRKNEGILIPRQRAKQHRHDRKPVTATGGRNPRSVLGGHTPALELFHYWLMENYGVNLDEAIELFKHEMTNPESVLDIPTAPYKGAHYATFPPKLIAPLIRASVPRRACPECGQAWAPVVEKRGGTLGKSWHDHSGDNESGMSQEGCSGLGSKKSDDGEEYKTTVTDYRPTCECGVTEHEPGIVLDPFGGSGTVGMVAKQLMRRWVVMDISRPYLDEQAKIRTKTGTPSNMLDGLPLFGEEIPNPKTRKQDEVGKRTYTGFNKRWDEKQGKSSIDEEGN